MPTYHGQTVDVAEGFEGTYPNTGWSEVDASSVLSKDAGAKYEDTYGLKWDQTGAAEAHVDYDIGSDTSPVSVGFWIYAPAWTNFGGLYIVAAGQNAATDSAWRFRIGKNGGTGAYECYVSASNGDASGVVTLAESTWYWVTLKATSAGNIVLRVYNTAHALVGSEVTVACGAYSVRYVRIGPISADTPATAPIYFDSVVIDWTAAAYPLLGWDASATASFIPGIMRHHTISALGGL